MRDLPRIALAGDRQHHRGGVALLRVLDGLQVDLVDLPQERLAPVGRRVEQGHRRGHLVVDDVAQGPVAAEPGARVVEAGGDVGRRRQQVAQREDGTVAAAGRLVERRALLIGGCRDADAGHLGEQADLVVPPARPGHGAFPEVRVRRVVDDADLALGLERRGLRLPQDRVPPVDQRVHVRVDGIGRRHHEHARAVARHLVLVQPDDGEPVVPHELGGELALLQVEHEHVAVVVVPRVRMVEERQRAVRVLRADVAVEPVGDQNLAVRIEARHQQEDHVVQDLPDLGRVVGGEPVDQLERHLGRADLGRVDAAGHEHDDLALVEDGVALGVGGRSVLEVEAALELAVPVEILERLGRADFHQHEGLPLGGRAELAVPHAVRVGRGLLHVLDDAVPAGEVVVRAHAESQEALGRLELAGGRSDEDGRRHQGSDCGDATHRGHYNPRPFDPVCEAARVWYKSGSDRCRTPSPRDPEWTRCNRRLSPSSGG